jgi:hypothetical protein
MRPSKARSLNSQVLVVDGLPGCGKSMLSRIFASINRVELMTYSYQLEWYCSLNHLKNLDDIACKALIDLEVDLKIYNSMMGREVNFRVSDLSSIYNYPRPEVYIRRTAECGDDAVLKKINDESPILNLAVHNLLPFSRMLFETLGKRLCYVNMVRHPLYMIKQQALNFERYIGSEKEKSYKDFTVYCEFETSVIPCYVHEWPKDYLTSNNYEKSIFFISNYYNKMRELDSIFPFQTIPFEGFVKDPEPYMNRICALLDIHDRGEEFTQELRRQNLPRQRYSDGQALQIYKDCGWTDLGVDNFIDEKRLLLKDLDFLISAECRSMLSDVVEWYEGTFMADIELR